MPPSRDERRQLRGGAPRQGGGAPARAAAGEAGAAGGASAEPPPGTYGAAGGDLLRDPRKWIGGTARWLETSEHTDPGRLLSALCEDFKPRRLKAPLVLCWLVLQATGLLYQGVLLSEVSTNLGVYEEMLATYCGPEHRQHGVCLGPSWNMSFSGVLNFPPAQGGDGSGDFDFVIPSDQSFVFQTSSQPPTFLLGVEPLAPQDSASWKASIAPKETADFRTVLRSDVTPPSVRGSGRRYTVHTGKRKRESGNASWTGSVALRSKYASPAQIHVYVVDSNIKHLEDIHGQAQCSFEQSWQNFGDRQSGSHHEVLIWAQRATAVFLLIAGFATSAVVYKFFYYVESSKLLTRIIVIKFLLQDLPQQLCIALYLYAWYAPNGLRCQACLFHPLHCNNEHPLHWTNLIVCVFTLLSASANQILLKAKSKKYDEEEECFLFFTRASMLSVSVLPFSTAVLLLSSSLFHLRNPIVYLAAGVPALLGWGTCLCVPLFAVCDDDF